MRKGELYLEQVFVGAIVIAAGALPFLPEVLSQLEGVDGLGSFATGSIALGIAFLVGVPFDRFADSLTGRLDHHARLRFAHEARKTAAAKGLVKDDYFAENELRLTALRESSEVNAWIDYHRSRIRLARALAVYGPAMVYALIVGLDRLWGDGPLLQAKDALANIARVYLAWGLLNALLDAAWKLPRTDDQKFLDDSTGAQWRGARFVDRVVFLLPPLTLFVLSLYIARKDAADGFAQVVPECVAVAGIAVFLLSTSTWLRISKTYRSYLSDITKFPKETKQAVKG